MTTVSVWILDSSDGANDALIILRRFHAEESVQLQDAAIVNWPEAARQPSITQLHSLVGAGDFGGAFWGTVFALGFLVPALRPAISAGIGPLIASVGDVGLDEHLIKDLRGSVRPGTSALLLLTKSAVTNAVLDDMKAQQGHAELLEFNLTRAQESKLRRTFAAECAPEGVAPRVAAWPSVRPRAVGCS